MLSQVADGRPRQLVGVEQCPRGRRQQHLPAVRRGHDARDAVHVDADIRRPGRERLARVDARPYRHACTIGPVVRGELALQVRCRGDRVACAREDREVGVAMRIDLVPAGRVAGRAQDATVVVEHGRVAVAQRAQQPRRALDVGLHERDGAAGQRALRHGSNVSAPCRKSRDARARENRARQGRRERS